LRVELESHEMRGAAEHVSGFATACGDESIALDRLANIAAGLNQRISGCTEKFGRLIC
jgi:hypothetical protein